MELEKENGDIKEDKLVINDDAIKMLFGHYCQETGVRDLDKYIEQTFKIAKKHIDRGKVLELPLIVGSEIVKDYFGPKKFKKPCHYVGPEISGDEMPIGAIMTLHMWYSFGGGIKCYEADLDNESTEKLKISGDISEPTKESIEIAYSVAKKVLKRYDSENDFFEQNNVHITIPHKTDGGSAGTAMVSLFLSLALNLPIRGITMSGGISRKEMVLEVGDNKYKLDAAKALGIQHVILPQANKEEFDELEEFIKEGIEVEFASNYDQIFKRIFPDFKPKCAKKTELNVAQSK